MPRIALQLTENLVDNVCQMVGVETHDVFGDSPYAIITLVGPAEFNFKLVSSEEIFEAAAADSELQVISL